MLLGLSNVLYKYYYMIHLFFSTLKLSEITIVLGSITNLTIATCIKNNINRL